MIERIETGENIIGALVAGLSAFQKALEAEGLNSSKATFPVFYCIPRKAR
jgi:hypothetical protein